MPIFSKYTMSLKIYYIYSIGILSLIGYLVYPKLSKFIMESSTHSFMYTLYALLLFIFIWLFYALWMMWLHQHHKRILRVIFITMSIISICIALFITFIATQHNESETYCTRMTYSKEKQEYIGSRFDEETKKFVDTKGIPNWLTSGDPCKLVLPKILTLFGMFFAISFVILFTLGMALDSIFILTRLIIRRYL